MTESMLHTSCWQVLMNCLSSVNRVYKINLIYMLNLSCGCMTIYACLYYIAFRENSLVFALLVFFWPNKTVICSTVPVEGLQKANSFKDLPRYLLKTWHICISQSDNLNFLQIENVAYVLFQAVIIQRERTDMLKFYFVVLFRVMKKNECENSIQGSSG